jgi:hypothetical protein
MTSQGSAHGRFQRAIQRRNLFQAELAMREMGTPSLLDALTYLDLLAEVRESQLALAALASLCAGERDAVQILQSLMRRARPTLIPRVS